MKEQDFKTLFDWWKGLENDRGARAELRRARSPEAVVFCGAYHRLCNRLHWDKDKLAAIAGLAAHVKKNKAGQKCAEQMASGDKKPVLSEMRFRRILEITDSNELYISLLRAIRMLDGRLNLRDLAESVYWWNKITKKNWAYSYWKIAPKGK